MKQGTKLKLNQLIAIAISWMLMAVFLTVYDHLVLHTDSSNGSSESYSFGVTLLTNLFTALVASLIGGSFLVFFVNVKYHDKPYGHTFFAVALFFIVVSILISLLLAVVLVPLRTDWALVYPDSLEACMDFLKDTAHIKSALSWSLMLGLTQLALQINSKFGQPNLWDIIHGKYNSPQVEERIFMALDINDSTSIAERLGDEIYHALLKDFFADITLPILENRGNIYQYAGDEVIVAWNYKNGKEDLHCLKCFFAVKRQIRKKKEKYLARYDVVPTFKAGIHCGRVIAGEIGIIKRDITYSGDVLNTTSRILGKCAEFNEELIVSTDVLALLDYEKNYSAVPLGAIKLKGKEHEVFLNALKALQ